MIRLFRSKANALQAVIILALFAIALVPAIFRGITLERPEDATPLYLLLVDWSAFETAWLKAFILSLLFLIVVFSLARFSSDKSFHKGRLALPFFISALYILAFPQNITISPPLVAMIFLIPSMRSLFHAAGSGPSMGKLFNAGFFLALASLVSFPVLLLVPAFLFAMLILRFYKWNHWGVFITGLVIPWLYFIVLNWILDYHSLSDPWSLLGIYVSGIIYFFSFLGTTLTTSNYMLIVLLTLLLMRAMLSIYTKLDQHVIAARQLYRTQLWLALNVVLVFAIAGGMFLQYTLIFSFFPISVVSDHLRTVKKVRFANILLLVLCLVMMAGHLNLF